MGLEMAGLDETTLGENTKDPTTHWGSERIRHEDFRAITQDELEWRASGCWIALYIYYSTRGLRKAIHEATYCAILC